MPTNTQDAAEDKPVAQTEPAARAEPVWTMGRVLRVRNGLSLAEWTDADNHLRRGWLTQAMIDPTPVPGGGVRLDRPERGIPYGDALDTLVAFKADPAAFADALRRRGIWTYADVAGRVLDVQAALQTAYDVDALTVLQTARAHTRTAIQEN